MSKNAAGGKTLLLGKNGQVGATLAQVIPTDTLVALDRMECDLENPRLLREVLERHRPAVIINAAAYTAVDKAEEGEGAKLSRSINVDAVAVMAEAAAMTDALLVHYSTDYVFDGDKEGPYTETDAPSPLNVYGDHKLAGEKAILASGCKHYIFRTSWVYAPHGNNFAKTILRLAQSRDTLRIINDQYGVPTSAALLADVTLQTVAAFTGAKQGIYNLVPRGETTWADYARYLLTRAQEAGIELKCKAENVQDIPATEYPLPARRPYNSRLDTTKLCTTFGINLPEWQTGVAGLVQSLKGIVL